MLSSLCSCFHYAGGVSKGFYIVINFALWWNSQVMRKALTNNFAKVGGFSLGEGVLFGSLNCGFTDLVENDRKALPR